MKKTQVTFYHVGDENKNGSVLIVCDSKKEAVQYLNDWVACHSTKQYPFKKNSDGSFQSKFTRIYLEGAK